MSLTNSENAQPDMPPLDARTRQVLLRQDELVDALEDMISWVAAFAKRAGMYDAIRRSQRLQRARETLARSKGEHA